jgi:hypothetical protein
MKIPLKVQMWGGAIMCLLTLVSLVIGFLTLTHPITALDWIKAYSTFCGASLLAGTAWRGYQRRPKTGPTGKI